MTSAGQGQTSLLEGLVIRRYDPKDHNAVWDLHIEGVRQSRSLYPPPAGYEDDLHDISATYLGDGSNFWVVESPDGLIGMAAVSRVDERTGRVRRMRVTASWRRKGVAQALLRIAMAFCRECGYNRVILDTTHMQTDAHRLYERAGFTKTGEHELGPFRIFDYERRLD
jgi:GNAT superfamily N-acetyltransferase